MSAEDVDGVRSLSRGLALLEALNRDPHASIADLARRAGVPRSTAYRLLNTLERLGYVVRLATAGYGLTRRVRSLGDGFLDETWLNPAWEELKALGKELVWPMTLLTFEAASMINRLTTHELSPMSIDYGMSGRRFPVTETAAGRCYLAFCPEPERELILAMPAAYIGGDGSSWERGAMETRAELIRQRGYETRIGGVVAKTASIAVPVIVAGRVLCCISIVFIAAAMPLERAVSLFERPLKAGAARLVTRLS